MPWLVWLSGLSNGLQSKGLLLRSPVRAHAWVAGWIPSWGSMRGNHTLMFLSLFLSPFPSLKIKYFFKNKVKVRILLNTRMKNIDNSEQKLYYKFQRTDNIKYRTVSKLRIDKNPLLLGIETLQVALGELFW